MGSGGTGTSLGGWYDKSPRRKKAERKHRKRQEDRWASLSGPVRVSRIEPEDLSAKEDVPPAD